jgi:hypothetical protein
VKPVDSALGMTTIAEAVVQWRRGFESKTDSELRHELVKNNPTHPAHIAATQLLGERQVKREQDRHEAIEKKLEELKAGVIELKKPHWTVSWNFLFTVIGAVAAVLAAYFAYLHN